MAIHICICYNVSFPIKNFMSFDYNIISKYYDKGCLLLKESLPANQWKSISINNSENSKEPGPKKETLLTREYNYFRAKL